MAVFFFLFILYLLPKNRRNQTGLLTDYLPTIRYKYVTIHEIPTISQ